jgi:hypothetical protein
MTVSVITGLVIQSAALWIMHVGIRGRWLGHVGAIFLAVAVSYHGLTEIMQWLFPASRNSYRKFISQDGLDDWMLLASTALLLYTIAYVFIIRDKHVDPTAGGYVDGIKPKWLIAAVAPLAALTIAGSTATAHPLPGAEKTGSAYLLGGLAEQFLILVAGVAAAVLVAQRGPRWLLPTLLGESVLLSFVGNRSSIVFGCLITLYGLRLSGMKLPRKALAAGVVTAAILVLAVGASRSTVGRGEFGEGQGASDRSAALLAGGDALGSSAGWEGVRDETIYRLDGNTFGVLINTELSNGVPPVALTTVWNTIKLSIPSFLFPGKTDVPVEQRDEETYLINHFAIGYQDFIPGVLGTVVAYFGPWGLIIVALLLGAAMAATDKTVLRVASPTRLAFGSGVVAAVLLYEQGPPGLIINMRGAVVLTALVWLALRLRKRRARAPRSTPVAAPALIRSR